MERFDDHGRLVIPDSRISKTTKNYKELWVINHAYCANGHSLIDNEHHIKGYPGIRLAFRRGKERGEFVISAMAGDFCKIILSGEFEKGLSHDIYCPHCYMQLPVLMSCGCSGNGRFVIIGLTPQLNFNNAITFCNVEGCYNGAIVSSGEIIRHARISQGA